MKPRIRSLSILLCAFLLSLPACGPAAGPATDLTPINVQLSFSHQAEFAGLYAAQELGYYAEEGLDISFLEGGPEVNFIAPVASGTAQFGVAQPADLILARAAGQKLRSIAVVYRRSPIVFFALQDSGITRPQDFIGKKIRSTVSTDQTLHAMMSKLGISSNQYEIVPLPSDITRFASGEVPVWSGFLNVFVLEVQRAGYKINIVYPDDYRIHFYGDVLITTDDLIQSNPDLVQRFTRASLRGWTYAVENPDRVGEFVQRYNPNADPELESAKMAASIPLVNTGDDFIGWMKPEVWAAMEQTLHEQGLLSRALDPESVYTIQFLQEIYAQ